MSSRPLGNWFKESIKDDNKIFDNLVTVEIWHNVKDALKVDLMNRVVNHSVIKTKVENCLYRSMQDRNTSTVTQIRERFRGIQQDMVDKIDTVLEVPLQEDLVINEGDTVFMCDSGIKWQVIAVDVATLQTRYRLGMQRFA